MTINFSNLTLTSGLSESEDQKVRDNLQCIIDNINNTDRLLSNVLATNNCLLSSITHKDIDITGYITGKNIPIQN